MVFSSVEFLFFFLPVVLGIHLLAPASRRNAVLLVASLVFYTWGGGAFVGLLLLSAAADFAAGRVVARARARQDRRGVRFGVTLSVGVNLGLLGTFKYANFLVEQLNEAGEALGVGPIAWTSVALPIGISFYTFQSMSYTLDVATGRTPPIARLRDFVLYVALFPQLIAGPIVRYHEIAAQITERSARLDGFAEGAIRFSWGLAKKVLIADTIAPIADAAFGAPGSSLSAVGAWLGLLAFGLQIYFDFSGYSDMAIGLGRMFGFRFPENFARPYSAVSVTDFWRRWHITLSNWFRDYLYVPLGGSRRGRTRTLLNLAIVFVVTGAWHGARWTFVAWGAVHGAVMLWERWRGTRYLRGAARPAVARARTLLVVTLAWVLFRADSIADSAAYLRALVGGGDGWLTADAVLRATDVRELAILAIGLATVLFPASWRLGVTVSTSASRVAAGGRAAVLAVALPVALLFVVAGTFSPFLYFQF